MNRTESTQRPRGKPAQRLRVELAARQSVACEVPLVRAARRPRLTVARARNGVARFRPDQLRPARGPLPGDTLHPLQVGGRLITSP